MDEIRDIIEHALGIELLLDNVERYFGATEMTECYKDIANMYDLKED